MISARCSYIFKSVIHCYVTQHLKLNYLKQKSSLFVHDSMGQGASLIAQLAKILPAMQETLVRFLGWEDQLEKG